MDVDVASSAGAARGPLGRSFRRRLEEPRRAARRERRRHGAHSQPRRMEDARHGAGRLHVDVQPGRDRFQVCRAARRGLWLPRGERARAGRVSSPSTRRRSRGTGPAAFRRERRSLWRHGDDARRVPLLDAVAAAVVSPRRHVSRPRHAAPSRKTRDARSSRRRLPATTRSKRRGATGRAPER